jgi:Arc/MetJ family transcription regulator
MYPNDLVMDILSVVTKRLVDIDDELLEEATEVLGAGTMKEAVNRSLEEVVRAARRRSHARRLAEMEGLDLADPKVMSGAWR